MINRRLLRHLLLALATCLETPEKLAQACRSDAKDTGVLDRVKPSLAKASPLSRA
jgi:hypothetical protein